MSFQVGRQLGLGKVIILQNIIKQSCSSAIARIDLVPPNFTIVKSAAACCTNTTFTRLITLLATMKLLYTILAVVPLALAAVPPPTDKTACECPLVKCVSTQPEVCTIPTGTSTVIYNSTFFELFLQAI